MSEEAKRIGAGALIVRFPPTIGSEALASAGEESHHQERRYEGGCAEGGRRHRHRYVRVDLLQLLEDVDLVRLNNLLRPLLLVSCRCGATLGSFFLAFGFFSTGAFSSTVVFFSSADLGAGASPALARASDRRRGT
ncbi:histone superfamily protein [Actinidia rufa]|uniref:Histone superfamily protein n=1 Tax=Actinidia rufa TaxID=165716 RepID=A0A7J0F211_9ERIC|nr:histone superfamily protein [Actinidia rufa]